MKIIETIKYKVQERRIKKLEKDLTALRNKIKFDPRLLMLDHTMDTQRRLHVGHTSIRFGVWATLGAWRGSTAQAIRA